MKHIHQLQIFFNYFYFSFNTKLFTLKIVIEYDQEIPQSQTADNPVAPRGRAAQPSRDTKVKLGRGRVV